MNISSHTYIINYRYPFKYLMLLLFFNILILQNNKAQYTWTKIIGESENETAYSSLVLRDGNFLMVARKQVLAGSQLINQTYLVKLDPKGTIIWEKIYGNTVIDNRTYSVAEDENGNIFLAANWNGASLIKINSSGNILWQKFYTYPLDSFGAIRLKNNKISILTYYFVNGNYTIGLMKSDTAGNVIWSKYYTDTSMYDVNYNNLLANNSEYYIVGNKRIGQNGYGVILKIDTSGNLLWEKLTKQGMTFYSITQNSDYSLIATGNYVIQNSAFGVAYSFDYNGNTKWTKYISSDTLSSCISIVKAADNKFAIAGGGNDANGKFLLVDSVGYIESYINHNHNIFIGYNDIINCQDSGFLISGFVIQNNGRDDCYIVKTDKTGNYYSIGVNNITEKINEQFSLNVYPNPFNTSSVLNIQLSKESNIQIIMYNLLGQAVDKLYFGILKTGINTIKLKPDNLASGIYFLQVQAPDDPYKILLTKKIVYLK